MTQHQCRHDSQWARYRTLVRCKDGFPRMRQQRAPPLPAPKFPLPFPFPAHFNMSRRGGSSRIERITRPQRRLAESDSESDQGDFVGDDEFFVDAADDEELQDIFLEKHLGRSRMSTCLALRSHERWLYSRFLEYFPFGLPEFVFFSLNFCARSALLAAFRFWSSELISSFSFPFLQELPVSLASVARRASHYFATIVKSTYRFCPPVCHLFDSPCLVEMMFPIM